MRVTPRAAANRVERFAESIKVWVTASPTDGQANEAVLRALAERLDLAPSRLSLVRGATTRSKVVEVRGLTEQEAVARL